jgi:hypothetical protein
MALSEHVKTAYDARIVGAELKNAAGQLAFALLLEGEINNKGANALINALDQVGTDYLNWSEGKADHEEVFFPPSAIAELDQFQAEMKNHNPFN